jgi:hypothetical protein
MKNSKIFMFFLMTALIIGVVGTAVAHPTEILSYQGSSHSGCHGGSDAAVSGTLTVSTATSGNLITLTATVQGFTDALASNNNRSGTFAIGIPYALGDNNEFGLGITKNTVNGVSDYWGVGIWEVALDANGNTVNPLRFRVLAPEAEGTYNLMVAVLNAANSSGVEQSIIYLHQTIVVTVTSGSVSIASLALSIPFNSVYLYVAGGIVASGAIVFLIRRKRK